MAYCFPDGQITAVVFFGIKINTPDVLETEIDSLEGGIEIKSIFAKILLVFFGTKN